MLISPCLVSCPFLHLVTLPLPLPERLERRSQAWMPWLLPIVVALASIVLQRKLTAPVLMLLAGSSLSMKISRCRRSDRMPLSRLISSEPCGQSPPRIRRGHREVGGRGDNVDCRYQDFYGQASSVAAENYCGRSLWAESYAPIARQRSLLGQLSQLGRGRKLGFALHQFLHWPG
jgi:hypothetical protein